MVENVFRLLEKIKLQSNYVVLYTFTRKFPRIVGKHPRFSMFGLSTITKVLNVGHSFTVNARYLLCSIVLAIPVIFTGSSLVDLIV